MKNQIQITKETISVTIVSFLVIVLLASSFTACNTITGKSNTIEIASPERLIVIAVDYSFSTNTFPRPDTNYFRGICMSIRNPGGTVIVYGVGNPTDRSGIRCTLLPVPELDDDFTMSRQVEQTEKIRNIMAENERVIISFLIKIQALIVSDTVKQMQTDLNGCLLKVDILLGEPQYRHFEKYVFILSDGIQSINNKDVAARHEFKNKNFRLCLCGWKTKLPDVADLTLYESPIGFLEFINQ